MLVGALFLVSGLPVLQDIAGAAASPTTTAASAGVPSVAAAPSSVQNVTPGASSAPASNLCSVGIMQECASTSPSAEVVPAGTTVSSWLNITPPLPNPSPTERDLPAMSYDPSGHDVVLFGGWGYAPGASPATSAPDFLGDTWSFVDDRWTELINQSTCTPTTCPSPRAGAMMTYYPPDNGLILFGGYKTIPCTGCTLHPFIVVGYNDTWLFTNGTWTNITSSSGYAPPERYAGAMVFDPSDNYVLLFGGNSPALNSLGDTWSFDGSWTNLTSKEGGVTGYETLKAPEPRSFAAIANAPSGYVLLFGGADSFDEAADFDTIENSCDNGAYTAAGDSTVAWWFYQGTWRPMDGWGDICPPPPPKRPADASAAIVPDVSTVVSGPPCGRYGAALGWSPKNGRFALYGGYGSSNLGVGANCSANVTVLNDTWLYDNVSGGGFVWYNGGDSGDPSAREEMGYASDFTDDYFEIFGGEGLAGLSNSTWRFYEIVHARLTGPTSWNTGESIHLTNPPFDVTGYGGSGDLTFTLRAIGLRTTNTLASGTGCAPFTDGKTGTIPTNGTDSFVCDPDASSFNLYKILLKVTDAKNTTDNATASWIYEVVPPESEQIFSQYVTDFFQGIDLSNVFTVYAQVDGEPATKIVATLGNTKVTFSPTAGSPKWWNASLEMSSVAKGAILHAEALWGNWSLNATYAVTMVSFPSWLAAVYAQTGGSEQILSGGHGPFNRTFTVEENYSWNLGDGLGFSIPVELLGGDYDAVPSMQVVFNASSLGYLGVTATLPLSQPSIDLGPASLGLSVAFNLSGTFSVAGSTVTWVSATAEIDIAASLSMSIPIYGFSILGINVGFTLQLQVNVSAALKLILAPTTDAGKEIIPGIGVMIQNFLGTLSFALSAAINFGIGIASVGLGVGVSVALAFVTQPDFAIDQGWVNGTIFVEASFLFWSDSWNLASGTIYSWPDPPLEPGVSGVSAYDNGTNTSWSLNDRYYNVSGVYDANDWDPAQTAGRAIGDIYPSTEVTGAVGYNGAYLFFTNDNVDLPVQDGLQIAGEVLSSGPNTLTALPAPSDPGYLLFAPHAATLADGDLYVAWDALPLAEATLASPLDLSAIQLQGAVFDPVNASWGPVRTFSDSGIAESAALDTTAGADDLVELVSPAPLVNDTTPERLVTYSLANGAVISNVSVVGDSEIVGLRGGLSLALVETVSGNYTLVDTATGDLVAIDYAPPSGSELLSASFVDGGAALLALLYVGGDITTLVLYDVATGTTLATETLGTNVSEVEGITTGTAVYLFVREDHGVEGLVQRGALFEPFAQGTIPDLESYGLVQDGASIVVYGLATNGATSRPTISLWLVEIPAGLAPAPVPDSVRPSTASPSVPLGYLVYLGIAAGAVALLLGVLFVRGKPRSPPKAPSGTSGGSSSNASTASPGPGSPPAGGSP